MWISIMGSIVVLSACQRRKSKQPRCWESSWYFTLPMPIEAESPIVKPYTYHHTHMYIYIYIHIYQIYQSPILGYVLYSYLFLVMYIYIYIIFIKHLSRIPSQTIGSFAWGSTGRCCWKLPRCSPGFTFAPPARWMKATGDGEGGEGWEGWEGWDAMLVLGVSLLS